MESQLEQSSNPVTPSRPRELVRSVQQWGSRVYGHMSQLERATVFTLAGLALVSGVWSIISYIERNTELIAESGGTYHEAAVGQPRHLNPILASASDLDTDITRLVYSSLFYFDSQLELQPDLATSYELSDDGRIYTVHLRTDARWHDGQAITADDVVFTIRSIQTPGYASPLATTFAGAEVEKIDDATVRFALENPYAQFPASLAVGIVPEHVWASIPPAQAALAEQMLRPVGSGPFQFEEITTRRRTGEVTELRLVRNESYYGTRPFLDEILFTFYDTHEEAIQALIAGRANGVGFVPLSLLDRASTRQTLIHRVLLPQYFGLFFNQQHNEQLTDAGVRNALALATDRATIVREALRGEGETLHVPIPPGVFAFNDEIGEGSYDPEAARQNLEEAGWEDSDNDGILEKDDKPLAMTLTTTDWPDHIRVAELVKEQWREVGADVTILHVGPGTIQQTVIAPRDYDVLLLGELLPAWPDPYPFWHSSQADKVSGLNLALLKNADVDKLLEEARETTDTDERREKYKEFQGIILELSPAIILYRPHYLYTTNEEVRGAPEGLASHAADRFNNISEWHVNVRRVWQRDD